jgi:hypothetical protein
VEIVSNRTCLACLSRTPIHVLRCGHSICDQCATSLSTHVSDDCTILHLNSCPFGCTSWQMRDSFKIRRKPREAGVRILSRDGYEASPLILRELIDFLRRRGVRGIVELVVLESIMNRVGHNLPMQELFDVIMGTSTGTRIHLFPHPRLFMTIFRWHHCPGDLQEEMVRCRCNQEFRGSCHDRLFLPWLSSSVDRFSRFARSSTPLL